MTEQEPNPKRSDVEPASEATRSALVAEIYGLLGRRDAVRLEVGEADVLVFHSNEPILIAEDGPDGLYTRETIVSALGTGRETEFYVKEVITIKDFSDEQEMAETEVSATQVLALYEQPLTEAEGRRLLLLLRNSEKKGN